MEVVSDNPSAHPAPPCGRAMFKAPAAGKYSFCFNNKMTTLTTKPAAPLGRRGKQRPCTCSQLLPRDNFLGRCPAIQYLYRDIMAP